MDIRNTRSIALGTDPWGPVAWSGLGAEDVANPHVLVMVYTTLHPPPLQSSRVCSTCILGSRTSDSGSAELQWLWMGSGGGGAF